MRPSPSKQGSNRIAAARRRGAPKGRPASEEPRARVRLDVDRRRTQLVELGLAEFGTRSYDDVSIDLIAQSAGISKGLLYHYFATKRAFYLACVREAATRLLARMDLPADVPPLERLNLGLDRYLEYVRAHGGAFSTLMRSGVGADHELASIVDETRTTLLRRLTSGMADIFPRPLEGDERLASPLLQIALQGWVGLAEATSIAWVEACIASESAPPNPPKNAPPNAPPDAPEASEVRDLLARALLAILANTVR